jgi:manganese/iron transport system permease protein
LLDLLAEPLGYEFMRVALITTLLVAVTCCVLSSFVVLRGWSLLGDAISHSVLPGIAIALILDFPYFIGAILAGVGSSVLIGLVESRARIRNDTAIGVVMTGAFSAGLVIISTIRPTVDIFHLLFGNPMSISIQDLYLAAAVGGVALLLIGSILKEIVAYTFDPVFSKVVGVRTTVIHYILMILLSLSIVSALSTVGIILVVCLLVTPGATAQLVAKNFTEMLAISVAVGVTSVVAGLYLSYYISISSGGAIAAVATLAFFVVMIWTNIRRAMRRQGPFKE